MRPSRITSSISSNMYQMASVGRLYDGRLLRWHSLCMANGNR